MEIALIIAIGVAGLTAAGYYFSTSEEESGKDNMIGGVGGDNRDSESKPINQ